MSKSWWMIPAVALVMIVTGFMAVEAAPAGGRSTGMWPVGLATGCLLLARPRRAPLLLGLVFAVALLTIWAGGRPFDVSVGYAVGTTLGTAVVWRLLTGGLPGAPGLRTDADLRRYFLATGAGSAVGALVAFLTSQATGWGSAPLVALAIGSAHLASQLTLVPFFSRLPDHGSISSPGERALQWLTILTVTPLVFLPDYFPSLVFLVIPLLAWGALRISPFEALAQMVALLGFAVSMTTIGSGPFARVPAQYGLPPDSRGIMLAGFAITCALIVVPLLVRVGVHIAIARQAAADRDKIQNIVNSAGGVAIIGTDETGRITLFNPGAENLLGYESVQVLGRSTAMFHTPDAVAEKALELGVSNHFIQVALAMTEPSAAGTHMRFLRKDGVERTHQMTLTQLVDDRGHTTGYVSTSEDVTDRVDAQTALEDALHAERQAVERLRDVDAVKEAFVSSVSHELRTPITSILGYLEMLEDGEYGDLNDAQGDAVRRVATNSSRLLSLIDDLLTLSRIHEDGLAMIDRVFDLRAAVTAGYEVVAPAWSARQLDVRIGLPGEPVPFVGDREMIERVVVNLLSNAVKFTSDGGSVRVLLRLEGADAVITVRDTGMGIPEQEQDQLFTRFFRSTLAQRRAIQGSGLGLSIAKAIVEKHGGTITVLSATDRGTTFDVRVPVVT
ncbi:MAG: sensor signal transduction histidine kinase [Nocardioides sp.]|nr:sensor signal transduction histidine kinase [Nocardioides sp.]